MSNLIQLGNSDLKVSRIAAGCWQLSPRFWGEVEEGPWKEALAQGLEAGINFIDTANAYGEGLAETALGRFFKETGLRDQFVVATKFYWDFHSEQRFPNTDPKAIRRECEDSLQRMGIDCIDLYQLHAWDPLLRPDAVAELIADLKKEGKIRWFGVSNLNPEQMRMLMRHTEIVSLQSRHNLLARDVEDQDLPFCMTHNLGFLAYSPLAMGLLSGRYDSGNLPNDPRADRFGKQNWELLGKALQRGKEIADAMGLTLAQLALRWVLTHPCRAVALVGFKKPDHLLSALKAQEEPLDIPTWNEVADLFELS